jgi:MFS family permease
MEQIRSALKDSARVRWSILLLIAFVQAANYYFYDAISPLKRLLEDNFNITSVDYGLFVSAYSIPNTFLLMAVLGGAILDKLGIRRTGFMFVGMMAAGGLVTAYGASEYFSDGGLFYGFFNSFLTDYTPELKMMLLGRFLFGLGAETSIVVVSKVIVKWFKGKELALAFGVKIGLARAGSALALFYSAEIAAAASHWTIAIWFAAMLLLLAFLAFLVYTIFDVRIDKQLAGDRPKKPTDQFSFADLRKLLTNKSFIYVTMLCVAFYSAVFPFQAFSPDFLLNKFGMGIMQSGKIASILYWVTMFATPLFGFIVDKYGKSATLMIFGSVLLALIHLTFAVTYLNPVIPLVLLGLAIALVPAAMWPAVAKIVEEKRIGTAYGAMFSVQNLGLFLFPIFAGLILDGTNKNADIFSGAQQTAEVRSSKSFKTHYLDNKGQPIENKDLLASVSLYQLPQNIQPNAEQAALKKQVDKHGELIWVEYFRTRSDKTGQFTGNIGNDSIERVNMKYFDIDFPNTLLKITAESYENKPLFEINAGAYDTINEYVLYKIELPSNARKAIRAYDRIGITLTDTSRNDIILQEKQKVFFDDEALLSLKVGEGNISYANINYLDWDNKVVMKVKTPLNYVWAILMFAMLGVLGFVFALLLKREDKKAGYGLDLPSNTKT